jgi:hypothetical protein
MWIGKHRIILIWGFLAVSMLSIFLFSPTSSPMITILSNLLFLTIFVFSLFIVIREKQWSNKLLFMNFLLFSGYFLVSSLYPLMGNYLFPEIQKVRHFHYQFGTIYYHVFLLLAVTYLVVDMLFRNRRTVYKYLLSMVIVIFVCVSYYGNFFKDPDYLYNHPDIRDWLVVDNAYFELKRESGEAPAPAEIAGMINLGAWKQGKQVGELYPIEKEKRVAELLPYSAGQNYMVLLYRPLNKANVQINTFTIFLIFLFFAYQFKKDPPQGAYVEKIMFLILVLVSLESLHSWAYVRSVDWNIFVDLIVLGQYLSVGAMALLTLFFGLRLRFISTVQGEFYEQQLVSSPQRITRWRDWVDNFVLSYIFNSQTLVGRLLAPGKQRSG